MAATNLNARLIIQILITITVICSTNSFASALYFTADNFKQRSKLKAWQSAGISEDRRVELLRSEADNFAICTTKKIAQQFITQSSYRYMVNPEFTSGCFVNTYRFSYTIQVPHNTARTQAAHCFRVKNEKSAILFLTLWNDKTHTIVRTPDGDVKLLKFGIDQKYLAQTGAKYSKDGRMICKTVATKPKRTLWGLLFSSWHN